MDSTSKNNTIEVKSSLQSGYRVKSASLKVSLNHNNNDHQIIILHESKAFSDYNFHKDISLIQHNFVFFFKTLSGTWYNFPTIEDMFQFIGIPYHDNLISCNVINDVKLASEFSEDELKE